MDNDYIIGLMGTSEFIIEGDKLINSTTQQYVLVTSDLSNFKYINEIYGTKEGDNLIVEMAHFFFIDNPNCKLACHTGSDQFRALIDIGNRTASEEVEYISNMNAEFELIISSKYPNVFLHVYTGVYVINNDTDNIRIAIDKAHLAKKTIKGNFDIKCVLYDENNFKKLRQNMDIINAFNFACTNDGILLYLQPKFSISKNCIIGSEALARMLDQDGLLISPGLFIPLLEQTGMIGRLDEIMMEKVFLTLRKWIDEGKEVFPISVNVSRIRFSELTFVNDVINLQKKYNISPELIELEVTESTLSSAMDHVTTAIHSLRNYGFKVSVDDFGSGYSSLNQIATMPADIIKLDCAFAQQCLATTKGQKVVSSIISMLNDIDYDIICEGIETIEHRNLISSFGCDKIQGFFYDRPLPLEEFEKKYVLKKS